MIQISHPFSSFLKMSSHFLLYQNCSFTVFVSAAHIVKLFSRLLLSHIEQFQGYGSYIEDESDTSLSSSRDYNRVCIHAQFIYFERKVLVITTLIVFKDYEEKLYYQLKYEEKVYRDEI